MRTNKYLVILFLLSCQKLMAQDIHFSQFFMAPMNLSPAYMGLISNSEANLNYKNQWRTVTVPYETYGGSVSSTFASERKRLSGKGYDAAGLSFYNDRSGDGAFGNLVATGNFAHHFHLNKNLILGAGMMAGFGQKTISAENFRTGSQYQNGAYSSGMPIGENFANYTRIFFDSGFGLILHRQSARSRNKAIHDQSFRFTTGVTVYHLTRPDISFIQAGEKLYMRTVFFGMSEVPLGSPTFSMIPVVQYSFQGPSQELVWGGMFRYTLDVSKKFHGTFKKNALAIGVLNRLKDAVTITSLIEFDRYGLGISYDVNTSSLAQATLGRGGLEFALRVRNPFHSGQ